MLFFNFYFQIWIQIILLKRGSDITKDLLWMWNVWEATGHRAPCPECRIGQVAWGPWAQGFPVTWRRENFQLHGPAFSQPLTLRTIAAAVVKTNSFSRRRQMFPSFALPHGQTQTSFSLVQTVQPASLQIPAPHPPLTRNCAGRSGHPFSVKFTHFSLLSWAGLSFQWPLTLSVTLTPAGGSSGLGWAALVYHGWAGWELIKLSLLLLRAH